MRHRTLLVAALAATAASDPAPHAAPTGTGAGHGDTSTHAAQSVAPAVPFAATLAQAPSITGAGGWSGDPSWAAMRDAPADNRQQARWDRARALIGRGLYAEASGVLDTMLAGERALALVPAFQLARGVALAGLGRADAALPLLEGAGLATNPEACGWRLRMRADGGAYRDALREVSCALPAINGRPSAARDPFILAASEAAIATRNTDAAARWLAILPERDPAANLLRGRLYITLGQPEAARLHFQQVQESGTPEQRAQARLGAVEADLAAHAVTPDKALPRIAAIRFGWRGGRLERRALELEFALAEQVQDLRVSLRAGATLFRYFPLGSDSAAMLAKLQQRLATAIAPGSSVSLPDAAGLYWDYRELAPGGAEGDLLVFHLAERLRQAGLYGRAAELLGYQLGNRAQDVAQGPLSVKVAELQILAGHPDRALAAIRGSERPDYPDAMRWARKRVEAVTLQLLGKGEAALAALDEVPDAAPLRAEIQWRRRDWAGFAATNGGALPVARMLDDAGQAQVLRQAVALAMLGREPALAALRGRFSAMFAKLPTAAAFDVLTRDPAQVDPAALQAAMAAVPAATPDGSYANLLDALPARP